ncbi:hypothetical protein ACQY0O_003883 [Thecaphora frezii]
MTFDEILDVQEFNKESSFNLESFRSEASFDCTSNRTSTDLHDWIADEPAATVHALAAQEASFDKTFATAGTNISADESMDDCNLNISYSGLSGINQFNSMVDKLLTKDILNSPTLHSGSPSKLG